MELICFLNFIRVGVTLLWKSSGRAQEDGISENVI
jgi:hypothetical protein